MSSRVFFGLFFFFQAEDGIRYLYVTGVQTCALPIYPGRAFAFECSMKGFHYSTWGYRIEPAASGSRVTEWSEDLRPEQALELSKRISGVDDRPERNRQTMRGTLDRLASAVEGTGSSV